MSHVMGMTGFRKICWLIEDFRKNASLSCLCRKSESVTYMAK